LQSNVGFPAMANKLLLVAQTIESGLRLGFNDNGQVLCIKSNSSVLWGQATGSLFELAGHVIVQPTTACQADTMKSPTHVPRTKAGRSNILGHHQLGHLSLTFFVKMAFRRRAKGLPPPEIFACPSPGQA
jgi:hypothetical protein